MKCLVIGASAGLGRCLSERLAAEGHDLYLVASNEDDLGPLAADLGLRFGISTGYLAADLQVLEVGFLASRVKEFFRGPPTALLFVAGYGHADDAGPIEPSLLDKLVDVNFRSALTILNAFLPDMLSGDMKLCVGIGSVAAVRGRGVNMVYGAAKRGLEFYFEALRHRLRSTNCRVQFYRVGFMRTTMLGDRRTLLPAVAPEAVARQIVRDFDRDVGIGYAPKWWGPISLILRLLPWRIFRKLSV